MVGRCTGGYDSKSRYSYHSSLRVFISAAPLSGVWSVVLHRQGKNE